MTLRGFAAASCLMCLGPGCQQPPDPAPAAAVGAPSPNATEAPVATTAEARRAAKRAEPGVQMVAIDGGYQVFTQRVGDGPIKLLLLNGGPGVSHGYFANFADHLLPAGVQIIYYDQLGSFFSDQPNDIKLWTIDRFVREVETVRQALALDQFYILGNSWGGLLLMEYALQHPEHLKGIVISNMVADLGDYEPYIEGLRNALPPDILAQLKKFEAAGDLENPEYQGLVVQHLYTLHMCRLDPWPPPVVQAMEDLGTSVYYAMNGHSEFYIDGNLKGWSRKADLPKLTMPTLLLSGAFDTMNPKSVEEMSHLIPHARFFVCPNGSHFTWWDDEACYFDKLVTFLQDVEGGTFREGAP